jgi:hypothetical protein
LNVTTDLLDRRLIEELPPPRRKWVVSLRSLRENSLGEIAGNGFNYPMTLALVLADERRQAHSLPQRDPVHLCTGLIHGKEPEFTRIVQHSVKYWTLLHLKLNLSSYESHQSGKMFVTEIFK